MKQNRIFNYTLSNLKNKSLLNCMKSNFTSNALLPLNSKNLKITPTKQYVTKPDYNKTLPFGHFHTDYMLEIDHQFEEGWGNPTITPYHSFNIDPRNQSLHYAMQLFEGMKAFRNKDALFLFRPDLNMKRMNRSAKRLGFPNFDGEEFIKLLMEHVKLEKDWILDKEGYSLYLRPTLISMSDYLGVSPAKKCKLFNICSPVGPYFEQGGMKGLKVMCNNNDYVRAYPGGFGSFKLGA